MKTEERNLIAKVSAGITHLWLTKKTEELHANAAACFVSYVNNIFNYRGPRRNEAIKNLLALDEDITRWLKTDGYAIVKRGGCWMVEVRPLERYAVS